MRTDHRTILALATVSVTLAVAGCGADFGVGSVQTTTPAPPATVTVARVVDGDTLKIHHGRSTRQQTVRLALIDAPESSALRRGYAECGATEATTALTRLVAARTVTLRRPSSQRSTDRYGRLIREVLVQGCSVDEQLVRDGWAKPYPVPNGGGGQAANARIATAARDAKRHRRGVWARCGGFDR